MKKEESNTEEFTGKYNKQNFITKRLIDSFFNSVINLIPENSNNILEVGCGAGFSTEKIASQINNKKLRASDLDEELVRMARDRNPDIEIDAQNIYKLKFDNGSFDTVICLEVLEHLEEPEKALEELYRVSSKYMLVSVPREPIWRMLNISRGKYWSDLGNTPGHINHWSQKTFEEFVSKKFKIIETKTPLPWIMVLAEKIDRDS